MPVEPESKNVTAHPHGRDKYRRTVADVLLPGDTHVNHSLVKGSWGYRKYAPGDTVLEGLETEAREARIGLWADLQPVPPWKWRKKKCNRIEQDSHLLLHLAHVANGMSNPRSYNPSF